MIFDEETLEDLMMNNSINEVGLKIEESSDASGGVFIIKKEAILFNDISDKLIGKNFSGQNLKIINKYDSGEIIIYNEDIDKFRKVDTWIEDVYHIECAKPPLLNLPEDFDPKTETVFFNLYT